MFHSKVLSSPTTPLGQDTHAPMLAVLLSHSVLSILRMANPPAWNAVFPDWYHLTPLTSQKTMQHFFLKAKKKKAKNHYVISFLITEESTLCVMLVAGDFFKLQKSCLSGAALSTLKMVNTELIQGLLTLVGHFNFEKVQFEVTGGNY